MWMAQMVAVCRSGRPSSCSILLRSPEDAERKTPLRTGSPSRTMSPFFRSTSAGTTRPTWRGTVPATMACPWNSHSSCARPLRTSPRHTARRPRVTDNSPTTVESLALSTTRLCWVSDSCDGIHTSAVAMTRRVLPCTSRSWTTGSQWSSARKTQACSKSAVAGLASRLSRPEQGPELRATNLEAKSRFCSTTAGPVEQLACLSEAFP
mmetsp:Transcript_55786/g.146751  ORF Transcript_55786/g.146751 Transcript_55786/m.146751 type:complete len:208 (+) Transcript_55786:46-669(+)